MNSKKSITFLLCFVLISSLGNMVSFNVKEGTVKFNEVAAAPVIVNDADGAPAFTTVGGAHWSTAAGQGYNGDVHYDDNVANGDSATWTPTLSAGKYNVYLYWSTSNNRATNAKYTINYDGGTYTLYVNQQLINDQVTSGGGADSGWFFVGTFSFAATGGYVKLEDTGADGYIIADAVQFTPLGTTELPGFFIDEDDSGFTKTGSWTFDTGNGGIGNDRAYDTAGTAGDSATWTPLIQQTGTYRVSLHWTTNSNRATSAKYTIHHAAGNATVTIDQTKLADQTTVGAAEQYSGWYDAGSYTFNAGSAGYVKLDDTNSTAGQYIIADGVTFEYVPGTTTHFAVDSPATSAAGAPPFSVIVEALDANGYRVQTYSGLVEFLSSDAQAVLPGPTALTLGVGTIGGFTLKTTGDQTITARDSITHAISGSDTTTVTPGSATHFHVVPSTYTSTGCPTTFNVTATARDQFENIDTNFVPGAPAAGSNPADAGNIFGAISFTNGQATFTACKTIDGKITMTDGPFPGESNTIDITSVSGGVHHFLVNSLTDPVTAGSVFKVHVEARDYLDAVLTSYSGLVTFTSSDLQAVLPGSTSLTAGVGDIDGFTLKTVGTGSQTITAHDSTNISIQGSDTVGVKEAPLDHFNITAPTTAFLCPTSFTVTTTAVDLYNNIIPTYAGTPTIGYSPADGSAIPAAGNTVAFATGSASFSVCKTVDGKITLTDGPITGESNILNMTVVSTGQMNGTIYEDDPNGILDTTDGKAYWDTNFNGTFDAGEGAYLFLDNTFRDRSIPLNGDYTLGDGAPATDTAILLGNHWVTVRLPGYQVQTKNITVGGMYGDPTTNFGLLPFDSIIGRVTKPDGTGVVGVHIFAYPFGGRPDNADPLVLTNKASPANPDGWWVEAITDAYGNYVLQKLPPGNYDVLAYRREYIQQWKYNVVVDGRSYNVGGTQVKFNWHQTKGTDFVQFNYRYATLTGFVWSTGPLAGATVEIPGLGLSTTTDSNGAYQIDNIPMGWYYVVAKKTGYSIGAQFVTIGDLECDDWPIENFQLAQLPTPPCCAGTIQGRVTDGVQGLENALVEIPGLGWTQGTGMELYTDKTGYFIFTNYSGNPTRYTAHNVPAGANNKYYVLAHHPYRNMFNPDNESDDYHKVKAMLVVVLPDKITDADFLLDENPGFVKGRIINTDGIPVEGATVSVPNSPYTTVTDSFGAYVLKLPAEIYSEGCIFPDPETVCGVEEVEVTFHERIDKSPYPHGMYKAHYWVLVQKAGYKDEWMNVVPTPGGSYPIDDGQEPLQSVSECLNCWESTVLTSETGILKGSVYDSKGTSSTSDDVPLIDAIVTTEGRDINLNTWISNLYEFTEVPVGAYHIVVSGLGPGNLYGVEYNVNVSVDQITVKDLRVNKSSPPSGVISGIIYSNRVKRGEGDYLGDTVFDVPIDIFGTGAGATFEPGEGIAGVKVTPTSNISITNNTTDSYGFYVIQPLGSSPGSTTIVAEKSGWTTASNPAVSIVSKIYLNYPGAPGMPGARGDANITTFPMIKLVGSLSGRLTNADGRDITGAIATIFIPQSADGLKNTTDESDTNGFYIFEAVEYGTYLIEVCGGGTCGIGYETTFSLNAAGQGEPVTVAGNTTRDITAVKKVARVEGFVKDTGGNILVDAEVNISGKYIANTDCMGYYTILDVPQCSHTAIASKPGFKIRMWNNIYASIGLVEGEVFTADFTGNNGLEPLIVPLDTGTVEGFVDLELTNGFCEVEVDLNPTGQSTYTDCEGWWIILEVQPSSGFNYVVHFRQSGFDNAYIEGISVSVGNSTVVGPVHMKRTACRVTGVITDEFTGLPVSGATVRISDMHRTTLETTYGRTISGYATTTDSTGRYTFENVPWSDAQVADLNKTYAWTVYAFKDNYYVRTLNVIVDQNCADTSDKNMTLKSMWGSISGNINWDGCTASSATITATAYVAGSGSGTATISIGVGPYKIYPLKPGAYTVSASAGSCTVTPPSYTGATAIPVNAGHDTPNTNFTLSAVSSGTPPSVPTLTTPANGATGICPLTGLTFDWTDSTGTTPITYDFQLASDSGFATIISNQTGLTSSSATYSGTLSASTQYWWRVRASNSAGTSEWSTTSSFTTGTCTGTPPSIPTLVTPSDGATNQCPLTGLVFDWTDSTGTASITYTLQVTLSTDTTFASPVINISGIASSTYTASSYTLLASTAYRWRVNATNSLGTSGWSTVFTFTTGTCTTTETAPLVSVTPNSACPNSIYLSWSAATPPIGKTIAGYNIYRSTTAGVNYNGTPYVQLGNQLTYTDTGVSTSQAIYYYYVVRARYNDATLGLPSSEVSSYTTQDCTGGGGQEPREPEHPYPMARVGGSTPVASIEHSFLVTAASSMLVEKGAGEQSVNVKNTGAITQSFEVKAQVPEGFKVTFSTDNFSLSPTFSKELNLSVVPPPNVSEGVYDIKVIVNSDSGDSKTLKLSMDIYFPKLKLSDFSSVPSVPSAKEETKISAKVTNSGSKDEKANVYLLADGKELGKRSVLVTKGASVTVFFNWMASEGAHKFVFQMGTEKLSGELSVTNPLRIQAESLYSKAMGFFDAGNWQRALETFKEAKVLFDQLGESKDIDSYIAKAQKSLEADALFAQAQEYLKSGNFAKASEYFTSAEKAYSEIGNTKGMEAAREGMTKSQTTKSESKNASYAKVAVLFVIAAIGAASSVAFYLKSRKPKRKEIGIPREIKL